MQGNNPFPKALSDRKPTNIEPYMQRPALSESDLPALPEMLIEDVARKGDKVMLTGASKSGKTWMLLSLATCIAAGASWCGMKCSRGRVLFANLEIGDAVFMHRQFAVCEALKADPAMVQDNLTICNLRGKVSDISNLVDSLLAVHGASAYDVVIIDPAYKVQDGVENNADAITRFCGELDRLAEGLSCSVVYSHHHSKGYQAWKDAGDRASGSGVFARDADAIIDMIELQAEVGECEGDPFRMEFVLRGFPEHDPVNVWFDYPCHRVDDTGALAKRNARKPGVTRGMDASAKDGELAEFEEKLDRYMGARDAINRKEYERHSNLKRKKLVQLLKSSKRFENVSSANQAEIRRAQPPASNSQPTQQMQGVQGAAFL